MAPRKTRAAASTTATARVETKPTRSSKRGTTADPEPVEEAAQVEATEESATTAPKRATRSTRSTRGKAAAPATEAPIVAEAPETAEPSKPARRANKREATTEVEDSPKAKKASGGLKAKAPATRKRKVEVLEEADEATKIEDVVDDDTTVTKTRGRKATKVSAAQEEEKPAPKPRGRKAAKVKESTPEETVEVKTRRTRGKSAAVEDATESKPEVAEPVAKAAEVKSRKTRGKSAAVEDAADATEHTTKAIEAKSRKTRGKSAALADAEGAVEASADAQQELEPTKVTETKSRRTRGKSAAIPDEPVLEAVPEEAIEVKSRRIRGKSATPSVAADSAEVAESENVKTTVKEPAKRKTTRAKAEKTPAKPKAAPKRRGRKAVEVVKEGEEEAEQHQETPEPADLNVESIDASTMQPKTDVEPAETHTAEENPVTAPLQETSAATPGEMKEAEAEAVEDTLPEVPIIQTEEDVDEVMNDVADEIVEESIQKEEIQEIDHIEAVTSVEEVADNDTPADNNDTDIAEANVPQEDDIVEEAAVEDEVVETNVGDSMDLDVNLPEEVSAPSAESIEVEPTAEPSVEPECVIKESVDEEMNWDADTDETTSMPTNEAIEEPSAEDIECDIPDSNMDHQSPGEQFEEGAHEESAFPVIQEVSHHTEISTHLENTGDVVIDVPVSKEASPEPEEVNNEQVLQEATVEEVEIANNTQEQPIITETVETAEVEVETIEAGAFEATEAEVIETTEVEVVGVTETEIETTEADALEVTEAEVQTPEPEVKDSTGSESVEISEPEVVDVTEAEVEITETEAIDVTETKAAETIDVELVEVEETVRETTPQVVNLPEDDASEDKSEVDARGSSPSRSVSEDGARELDEDNASPTGATFQTDAAGDVLNIDLGVDVEADAVAIDEIAEVLNVESEPVASAEELPHLDTTAERSLSKGPEDPSSPDGANSVADEVQQAVSEFAVQDEEADAASDEDDHVMEDVSNEVSVQTVAPQDNIGNLQTESSSRQETPEAESEDGKEQLAAESTEDVPRGDSHIEGSESCEEINAEVMTSEEADLDMGIGLESVANSPGSPAPAETVPKDDAAGVEPEVENVDTASVAEDQEDEPIPLAEEKFEDSFDEPTGSPAKQKAAEEARQPMVVATPPRRTQTPSGVLASTPRIIWDAFKGVISSPLRRVSSFQNTPTQQQATHVESPDGGSDTNTDTSSEADDDDNVRSLSPTPTKNHGGSLRVASESPSKLDGENTLRLHLSPSPVKEAHSRTPLGVDGGNALRLRLSPTPTKATDASINRRSSTPENGYEETAEQLSPTPSQEDYEDISSYIGPMDETGEISSFIGPMDESSLLSSSGDEGGDGDISSFIGPMDSHMLDDENVFGVINRASEECGESTIGAEDSVADDGKLEDLSLILPKSATADTAVHSVTESSQESGTFQSPIAGVKRRRSVTPKPLITATKFSPAAFNAKQTTASMASASGSTFFANADQPSQFDFTFRSGTTASGANTKGRGGRKPISARVDPFLGRKVLKRPGALSTRKDAEEPPKKRRRSTNDTDDDEVEMEGESTLENITPEPFIPLGPSMNSPQHSAHEAEDSFVTGDESSEFDEDVPMFDAEGSVKDLANDSSPALSPTMNETNASDNVQLNADSEGNEPNGEPAPEEGITVHKEEAQVIQDAASDEEVDEDLFDLSEVQLPEPSIGETFESGNVLGQGADSDHVSDNGERSVSPSVSEAFTPAAETVPSSLEILGSADTGTANTVEEKPASPQPKIDVAPVAPAARGFNNSYLSSFLRRSAATKTQKPEENVTTEPQASSTTAAGPEPSTTAMKPAITEPIALPTVTKSRLPKPGSRIKQTAATTPPPPARARSSRIASAVPARSGYAAPRTSLAPRPPQVGSPEWRTMLEREQKLLVKKNTEANIQPPPVAHVHKTVRRNVPRPPSPTPQTQARVAAQERRRRKLHFERTGVELGPGEKLDEPKGLKGKSKIAVPEKREGKVKWGAPLEEMLIEEVTKKSPSTAKGKEPEKPVFRRRTLDKWGNLVREPEEEPVDEKSPVVIKKIVFKGE